MHIEVMTEEEYVELEAIKTIDQMYRNDQRLWTSGVEYEWLKRKIKASIIQQLEWKREQAKYDNECI